MKSKEELIVKALENVSINKLKDKGFDENNYKKFLISEICNIGIASRDIELLVQQIVNPGGPGLYRVTFEKGVKGTLAKFLDGSGFSSNVIETGKKGVKSRARLNPELFNPSMIFLEITIHRLEAELSEIKDICQNIFDKIVDENHNEILSNYESLLGVSKHYKYNIENDSWCNAQLSNCINIANSSSKSFRNTITNTNNIIKKTGGIHLNEKKELANEIFEEISFLQLTLICYSISSYYQLILKKFYAKKELDDVVDSIQKKTKKYAAFIDACSNEYCNYLKSMKLPKKAFFQFVNFLVGTVGTLLTGYSIGLQGSFSFMSAINENIDELVDERTKELVKAFKDVEKNQFLELNKDIYEIDCINNIYENKDELYLDDKYIYIKNTNG